jgi:hypothetical protein
MSPPVPLPGADPPRKRRFPLWAKIGIPVVLIIVIAAAAGGSKKKDSPVASSNTAGTAQATTAKPASKSSYAVGETARTGDFDVTVYGFKDPQASSNQFDKPKAGNHYVSVDVQVANKGTKQLTFSSIIGFHLVDGANRQFDEGLTSIKPGPPEGEIPAGEAVRGMVVFEVPDGSTGLRMRVQGNLTASGAFFTLT